jgi:hypothetical protein
MLDGQKLDFPAGEVHKEVSSGLGKLIPGAVLVGVGVTFVIIGAASGSGLGLLAGLISGGIGCPFLVLGIIQRIEYNRAQSEGLSFSFEPRTRTPMVAYAMRF